MRPSRYPVVLLAVAVVLLLTSVSGFAAPLPQAPDLKGGPGIEVGVESHHDVSPPLREMKPLPIKPSPEHEANENPPVFTLSMLENHIDPVVQTSLAPLSMPAPTASFDGIAFPGVDCNCAPPDTNGEVGASGSSARGWARQPSVLFLRKIAEGGLHAATLDWFRRYFLWFSVHSRQALRCDFIASAELSSAAREMRQSHPSATRLPG